jgi:GNAT superfamily N-acetyltransferase
MDMLVKLYELPDMAPTLIQLKKQGIEVRAAMPLEKHLVIDWVRDSFGKAWASECEVAFSRQPITCHIAVALDKLIGFACFESSCKGFFGPIGVDPSQRGQDVGKGLLLSCLHAMAAMGYGYAIIGAVGPSEFFAKAAGATEIEGSSPGIYRSRLK